VHQHLPSGTLPVPPDHACPDHADWLATHRPDLAASYRSALPGARAAVLGRLWGALAREPLPGRQPPVEHRGQLTVMIHNHQLSGPTSAAEPFATVPASLTISGYGHPASLVRDIWPHATGFAAELAGSVANLALARAAAATGPADDSLAAAEQSIVDGHPLHPGCRTRTGLSTADLIAYAPEHRPTVALPVLAVPPERWHSTGAGLPPRLTAHPWQWQRLRDTRPDLLRGVLDTGERIPGRPLQSLRTFATPHGHLKTAIDAQLTSATRTVSAAALANGPVLSALLADLTRGWPTFGILAEPAGGALLVDGLPWRSLAVLHRLPPALRTGERAFPLAATDLALALLPQGYGGDPGTFLHHLAGLLLPPLLRLLDLGVALEAHGQNLLLVTAHGRARRLLYRDFGGVRVLRRSTTAPLHGDVGCDDPERLRTKLLAAAVSTVLSGYVAAFRERLGADPDRLWAAVAAAVPPDTPQRRVLTHPDTLPLKAMTAMRLANTTDDLWTTVPNPLVGR
jgi:siderophore synthetase component